MEKKLDPIRLVQSAKEALDRRETIGIELELKKLQECCHLEMDIQLKFELHWLIYRMLEFLKKETEALDELENMLKEDFDNFQKCLILKEIGLTYMRMKQQERGLEHLKRYYSEAENNSLYNIMADAALWLARFFYAEKDYEQAMEYANQAIYASRKEHNLFSDAESQLINGLIFYHKGELNLALDILREAEETAIDANALVLIQRIAISRCKIYVDKQDWESVTLTINNLFKTIEP